ncbi:hypothetical protein GALL_505240 [mine drainage metagenome]|uniref:Uncharacterized protein n=1 Tax=mine drainage metagenome TaxID=410659 RepID=A0A1J5P9F1_9ZZZZ
MFGKAAVRGDLAAKHRQKRRAGVGIERKDIVARGRRGGFRAVVIKRAHAGIGPHDVIACDGPREIVAGEGTEVVLFFRGANHLAGFAVVVLVRGADQGEVGLIGNRKDDAAVGTLEEIAAVVVKQAVGDDVAAAHKAHALGGVDAERAGDDLADPGPAGVDQNARHVGFGGAVARDLYVPKVGLAPRGQHTGAGQDLCAARLGVAGVEDDEARILDPAIGIFKGAFVLRFQRAPGGVTGKVEATRAGQDFAPAKVVIDEQAKADQPSRAHPAVKWQHKAHRPTDMRHGAQQGLALDQRLSHQTEFVVFQIAQAAMKQLGRGGGGRRGEVIHFGQRDA